MIEQLVHRAVALHQAGRVAEAEALYRQALSAGVSDPQLRYLHATALFQLRRLPEALTAVEAALRAAPGRAQILLLHGAILLGSGRPTEALASLTKACAAAPANADAWYNQGVALSDLGRLEEALAAFDRSLALDPSVPAFNNRGAALRRLGRRAEALVSVDRALASAPNFAPALRNRALILWELGRTAEALAALKRALTLEPNDANDWANAAALLYLQDRCAEAVADAERALALRPDHAAAWATRGYALSRLGRAQDALASFDRALAASAEQAEVWLFRGETLLALQRPAEALASYDRALALDPASPDAFAGRGRALSTLGRHDDALIDCRQATQAAPERADFWINFSVALGIVQRLDEALVAIERALALEPSDPAAQLARGQLLCEMGRTQEGLAQIAQRARQLYGEGQASEPPQRAPEAKARHDEEQRAYLAVRGVKPGRFHIDGGDRTAGPAVNPANRDRVADQWAKSRPQMVVIDQLLTPPALEGLRRFCWGSTVWRRSYRQGYLGAMLEHGFACPLLAQIAEELRETFPTMVGDHPLLSTWGFKYDSRLGGIRLHADQAAVNVNFWITPQEANLNPDSGGMVIWDVAAPADWDISRYNSDDASVQTYLADAKAKSIRVPYRENRAVVFDSDLFHETDTIAFREGYQNRRINVTMLYGRRNFHNI